MSKTKTHAKFVEEIHNLNSNIEILDKYKNSKTKLKFKCLIDNTLWYANPSNLLSGKGCPQCAKKIISNSRKNSHEVFIKNLSLFNKTNRTYWNTNDIYIDNRTPIAFYCSLDNYSITARPTNLLSGCYRCKECYRRDKEINLKKHIENNNLPIKIVGKYSGSNKEINCECTLCHNIYKTLPNRILSNDVICRSCAYIKMGEESRISLSDFLYRLSISNPYIEYIDNYNGMSKKVHVKCKKCSTEWFPIATDLVNKNNRGCPICNLSKGENVIIDFLLKNNIMFSSQKTFDDLIGTHNTKLRYDFYLSKYNLLIEYQGIQHEKPIDFGGKGNDYAINAFKIQQEHDKRKKQYAKDHNIKLLEIWYWDFDNIEKILSNIIKEKKDD